MTHYRWEIYAHLALPFATAMLIAWGWCRHSTLAWCPWWMWAVYVFFSLGNFWSAWYISRRLKILPW